MVRISGQFTAEKAIKALNGNMSEGRPKKNQWKK
jgi:hypothetical protein